MIIGSALAMWAGRAPDGGAGVAAPRADVSIERLRENLHYLASDELGGRAAGTDGYEAAAVRVEDELREYGLDPLFVTTAAADTDGGGDSAASFRQRFALHRWEVARQGSMTIERGADRVRLDLLQDVQVAYAGSDDSWGEGLRLVYGGAGVVEPDLGYDELAGLDLQGSCVVLLFDLSEKMIAEAPAELRARNPAGNAGVVRRALNAARRGARCVITVPGPRPPDFWEQFLRSDEGLTGTAVPAAGDEPFVEFGLALSGRGSAALFRGQPYDPGVDDAAPPFEMRGVTVAFDLRLRELRKLDTDNLGALVPGTDPALDHEMIVLTAHLDGQGTRDDGVVLNSANDNAASVVALLEAARLLAEAPARRPIVVLFPAAEENGLLGSAHFVDHPPVDFARFALNVNLEMVGKRRRSIPGYEFRVAGRHSDAIEGLVAAVRRRHGDVDFDYERRFDTPDYQYRRSDHVHFFLRGVPTIYFYGGGADYHQPSDDADRVEYGKVATMAQVLVELIRVTDTLELLPRSDGRP